jgi:glycerol-3-phosphate acyltransferase PlsX
VFLGLNGICVKSHGGTDALGFAYAVGTAVDMVRYGFNEKVVEEYHKLRQALGTNGPAAAESAAQ